MSDRPNLILIMCDQMRHDCAGFAHTERPPNAMQTPNLDRLAASGVVCEQTYCASPVCSPARASWMTGLYPHATGQLVNAGPTVTTPWAQMHTGCQTLGDLFNAAGYRCGISGPWHLGDDPRPQHGFESFWHTYRYQGKGNPDRLVDYFESEGVANIYTDNERFIDPGYHMPYVTLDDPRQQRTTWTIDQGIEFIEGAGVDPYFLFLSVKDPHPVIAVAEELVERYPAEELSLPSTWADPLEGKPAYQHQATGRLNADVDEVEFRRMMAHYYALVTHIDAQVGRLIQRLEELDQRQNTVIAFISDHGEMLGDHGFTTKVILYEGSVRVPCVLSWPAALTAGQRIRTPLGGVDLMPTLAELCGIDVDADSIDGRSIAAALRSGVEPEQVPVFAEICSWKALTGSEDGEEDSAARVMVRDGPWKYVRSRNDEGELYDLDSDPDEMVNLAVDDAHDAKMRQMRTLIAEMAQRTGPGPYEWVCAT